MVKIEVLEPVCSPSGVFYCAGYVRGVYMHFLSYDRLSKAEIKNKLLDKYKKENILIKERDL